MSRKQLVRTICALAGAALPMILFALQTGPDPRKTGAPGDAQLACASALCHTREAAGGPINFHGGSVTARFSNGSFYTPGEAVVITVNVQDPMNTLAGFQMTARRANDLANGQAGTFSPDDGTFVLCEDEAPRGPSGCSPSAPLEFIEHFEPRSTPWTFTWTPPAESIGEVHFYVAGNAVNGNGVEDGGDHVYTNDYVLRPAGACVTGAPSIEGIVTASQFGQSATIGSGTWLEIYGSNLSTRSLEWGGLDFTNGVAPTQLDQVKVAVNGRDAFVRFAGPGQVNVQAPDDDSTGPVNVTVTNCEQSSEPFEVQKADVVPGLLAGLSGENSYLRVFRNSDGAELGSPAKPVKPGEIVVIYGIGFGATTPFVGAGSIAAELNRLARPLSMKIGGVELAPSDVFYSGLGPGFVGLNQFTVRIPEVPDGDAIVSFDIGGVVTAQELLLAVQR